MKLFKKALAAVLAGVMALSMVACAPANNDTDKKEDNIPVVSTEAEKQVVEYLNSLSASQAVVAPATYMNAVTFENELKDVAQNVLDKLAAGTLQEDGVTVKLTADQQSALKDTILNGYDFYIIAAGNPQATEALVAENMNLANYAYSLQNAKACVQRFYNFDNNNNSMLVKVKDGNKLVAKVKIGVASKVIGERTYVVMVMKTI